MRTLARIVLGWLLAIALPAQGFAVAAMLPCAPGHAPIETAVGAGQWHAEPAGAHPHPDAHARLGASTQFEAPASVDPHAEPGASTCSACAAGCCGSALPASAVVVAASPRAAEPIPEQRQPGGDFVVERLEHPPRSLAA